MKKGIIDFLENWKNSIEETCEQHKLAENRRQKCINKINQRLEELG